MAAEQMELEGFGASLIGRTVYVNAAADVAWIPWEFITGTMYTCKILVTGEGFGTRSIEAEGCWTVVVRPANAKDWSMIATIMRGMGGTQILVFDSHAPRAPDSFVTFMDALLGEGRIVLTRVWIGEHAEIPAIPDAIFFPVMHTAAAMASSFAMVRRLPARNGHGIFRTMGDHEWNAICNAAAGTGVGVIVSDVGESEWSLFWHKVGDSRLDSPSHRLKRGLMWLRTGAMMIEHNADV